MEAEIIRQAKEVAVNAVLKAGQIVKEHFDQTAVIHEKGSFGDVVTEMDFRAEEIILQEITRAFPDHQITSEESGLSGKEGDWLWMVDPLDGTNNYAIGLPVFSLCITLLHRREAVLGVIYEPMVNRLYVAVKNEGAWCNGQRMQVRKRENPAKGTVGWIQGHQVQNEPAAVRLKHYIDVKFKRMIRLWAPSLQWCMLAKGDLDGIVLYNSEGDDLYAGVLMVKEAGGLVIDFDGNDFVGMNNEPYIIACHPESREFFLQTVREGLDSREPAACQTRTGRG
jgi:myo-inositol-1(or 4)-monophosphatase